MKNRFSKKTWAILIAVLILIIGSVTAYAATTAGSESDPLVTKSYVDAEIAKVKNSQGSQGSTGGSTGTYEVVHLQAGDKILGGEGTEIILRSGEAKAVDNGSNGISDLTAGTELWSGNSLKANHVILIPRADGRGVNVTTEAYFMIRGSYTIQ